jgi:hypothetical protein
VIPAVGQIEGLLQPFQGLREIPAHLPEAPQRGAHAERRLGRPGLDGPAERGPQVVMVLLEPVEHFTLRGAHDAARRRLGEADEVACVPGAQVVPAAELHRLLDGELADRLQHREAWVAADPLRLADEALLDERGQRVEAGTAEVASAHRLDCVKPAPADEDRKARKEGPIGLFQHVVAPGDGAAQGLLPLGKVA